MNIKIDKIKITSILLLSSFPSYHTTINLKNIIDLNCNTREVVEEAVVAGEEVVEALA